VSVPLAVHGRWSTSDMDALARLLPARASVHENHTLSDGRITGMGLSRRRMTRGLTWPQTQPEGAEKILLQERANWSRRGIARGGTLVVTNNRIVFQPNSMETLLGLHPATWQRTQIKKVDVAPRSWSPFSGALRRRLRIEFLDSTQALFVVPDPESASLVAALHS
jgi:hypothetical protein